MLLLSVGFVSFTHAQAKKKGYETVTIKTPGANCELCKSRIESYMKREEGVTNTVVDFKRGTTKVTFWNEKTNIENVKTGIANAGYDADDVTANPDSYKQLPRSCKKPEDGGPTKAPNIHAPPVVKQ